MKKAIWIFLFFSLFLGACSQNKLVNVNSDKVNEFLAGEGTVYLYVGRPTCPECQEYQPILEEALQQSTTTVYYYNTDDARATNESELEAIAEKLEVIGVPSVYKLVDGKVDSFLIGVNGLEGTVDFLNN